jgi:uncharacterized RDD family membrane protein YckC
MPERKIEPEPESAPVPALALAAVAAEEPSSPRRPAARVPTTTEMPLFVKTMGPQELGAFAELATKHGDEQHAVVSEDADADDEDDIDEAEEMFAPPVPPPPSTRPLSVRRPVAEPRPAPRIARRPGPMDNDLLEDLQRLEREEAMRTLHNNVAASPANREASDGVSISHRAGAAALDGLLLGGIGAFVLWATLRVTDASPSDLGAPALIPMGVFIAGVGVTYLLMFTAASGQTVGKMLMGIRVIPDDGMSRERITLGQAASRAILAPLSAGLLGLGWVPALVGRGPTLHDRLSHTRVVRA